MIARRHVRMPHGAQKHGVELPQLVRAPLGQRLAGLQISLAAPIEMRQLVFETLQRRHRIQNLQRLGRHFRTGPVAGNHGNLQSRAHNSGVVRGQLPRRHCRAAFATD